MFKTKTVRKINLFYHILYIIFFLVYVQIALYKYLICWKITLPLIVPGWFLWDLSYFRLVETFIPFSYLSFSLQRVTNENLQDKFYFTNQWFSFENLSLAFSYINVALNLEKKETLKGLFQWKFFLIFNFHYNMCHTELFKMSTLV